MSTSVFRFAPSPNGYLHLGHAFSALLNRDLAHATSGRLLLRIEDIDPARSRPEFETAIYEDLAWLGLEWERPVRRQSEHFDAYRDGLTWLRAEGLLYPSFESRGEIAQRVAVLERERDGWPRDPDGAPLYPGASTDMSESERGRRIAEGDPHAWRLDMQAALARTGRLEWDESGAGPGGETGRCTADPAAWGDVVLGRRDASASYHLAVVIDDARQGVTDVVRGVDLFPSTSVHRLLQQLLGLPAPRYRHHRLVLGADGRKLSKSSGSTGLRALRADGVDPAAVRARVGLG